MVQVEELFFENPGEEFYIRQLSRITGIPKTTVSRRLGVLLKKGMIIRRKSEPFSRYAANTASSLYKFYKRQHILEKIMMSGIVDYLADLAHPSSIVLFGSCAKGEYSLESDIDIYMQCSEASIDLKRFRLKHRVNILFSADFRKISEELRNNIINGIVLYGTMRL